MFVGQRAGCLEIHRQCGHLTFSVGSHQLTPFGHQAQCVGKREHTRRYQCAVFAQTVPCSSNWLQRRICQFAIDIEAGDMMGEQHRLSKTCQVDLVIRVLK